MKIFDFLKRKTFTPVVKRMFYRIKILPDQNGYIQLFSSLDESLGCAGSFKNKLEMLEIVEHLTIIASNSKEMETVIIFDNRN